MLEEQFLYAQEGPVHFTYKKNPDMSSLCQGDLLQITEDIRNVLRDIHPYFLNEQYKFFMVLTQSCDLVRRDGSKCKTPYITLAAVRSFDSFFENKLLSEAYAENINGCILLDSKKRMQAYQLLERLYNNTEPDYFFLYKENLLHFPESMVACLKVSIALKSELHYDQCLAAKVLELSDEFKAKLGWLVGNIYSRVGTTDWESILTRRQRKNMLEEELRAHCVVASKEQINALKTEIVKNADQLKTQESVVEFISQCYIESKYDSFIKEIEKVITEMDIEISDELKARFLWEIKNRTTIKAFFPN